MPARATRIEAGPILCLQEQSPLFNKFAFEIRQTIYSHVVAGHFFHIMRKSLGLRHVCCSKSRFDDTMIPLPDCCRRRSLKNSHSRLLSLLRACRRVYAETIDLLYEGNTFGTKRIPDFNSLTTTATPQRYNTIRKVTACWKVSIEMCSPGYVILGSSEWEKAWSILSQMENLRELAVKLQLYGPTASAFSEMPKDYAELLFMQIERLILHLPWTVDLSQKWRLYVNWPQCVTDDLDHAPFVIERADMLF